MNYAKTMKNILPLFVLLFALVGCVYTTTIYPNEVAVVQDRLTGEILDPLYPGIYFLPLTWDTAVYSTAQQQYHFLDSEEIDSEPITARSLDGEAVYIELSLLFRIDPANVTLVHRLWQDRYAQDLVDPVTRGIVREVIATMLAEVTYGPMLDTMRQEISTQLAERLAKDGLILDYLVIRNVRFSPEFTLELERTAIIVATQTAEALQLTPTPGDK